jgi:hypothetical protein
VGAILRAVTLIGAFALVAAASAADDLQDRRQRATATIEQAQAESARVEDRYRQASQECAKGFFVNPCLADARRARDQQLRLVREREVAARDTLRRLDAEERALARDRRVVQEPGQPDSRTAAEASGDASTPTARPAHTPAPMRTVEPKKQDNDANAGRASAEQRRAEAEQRAAERAAAQQRHAERQSEQAAQAADRAATNEQRQREAQERAAEKARIAEENRQRRERRAEERAAKQ